MEQRIFSLLRAALLNEEPDVSLYSQLQPADWDSMLQFGMKHNIAALLCDGLSKLPAGLVDRRVWLRFCAEQSKTEATYQQKRKAMVGLVEFFHPRGIKTMALKGLLLADCYPNPSYRKFGDLDIYQFGDYQKADKLISTQLGINVSNDAHHHTKYCFSGVTVENHYDFVNRHTPPSNRRFEQILKEMAGTAEQMELDGQPLWQPTPTFQALFLIRHNGGHFATGQTTVRDLCDWRMFLSQKARAVDWSFVNEVLREYNMHQYVAALQAILEDHLGLEPMAELPRTADGALAERVFNDIFYGEFAEAEHEEENLGRVIWKIRRRQASRWKHEIVFSDSWSRTLASSLYAHLLKPRSILHKV